MALTASGANSPGGTKLLDGRLLYAIMHTVWDGTTPKGKPPRACASASMRCCGGFRVPKTDLPARDRCIPGWVVKKDSNLGRGRGGLPAVWWPLLGGGIGEVV